MIRSTGNFLDVLEGNVCRRGLAGGRKDTVLFALSVAIYTIGRGTNRDVICGSAISATALLRTLGGRPAKTTRGVVTAHDARSRAVFIMAMS